MYIDYEYYKCKCYGKLSEDDFPEYLFNATQAIDNITRYRVKVLGLNKFPDWIQEQFKQALCAQIDYYCEFGLELSLAGNTADSFTVGKVSVSSGSNKGDESLICPKVITLLECTGLLDRSVATLDRFQVGY